MVSNIIRVAAGCLLGASLLLTTVTIWQLLGLAKKIRTLEQLVTAVDFETPGESARLLEALPIVTSQQKAVGHLLRSASKLRSREPDAAREYAELCLSTIRLRHSLMVTRSVLGLGLALMSCSFLGYDLVKNRNVDPIPAIADEISRIVSGRVPAAINYHNDIVDDINTIKGYITVLESRQWGLVRAFADTHVVPAVLENLTESLADLGPILQDIDDDLKALLQYKLQYKPQSKLQNKRGKTV